MSAVLERRSDRMKALLYTYYSILFAAKVALFPDTAKRLPDFLERKGRMELVVGKKSSGTARVWVVPPK